MPPPPNDPPVISLNRSKTRLGSLLNSCGIVKNSKMWKNMKMTEETKEQKSKNTVEIEEHMMFDLLKEMLGLEGISIDLLVRINKWI